jgi:pyruvate kinase
MILSNDLSINTIVIMTENGMTALKMAQYRPKARIFALCPSPVICRQLALIWGIISLPVKVVSSTDEMIKISEQILKNNKLISSGGKFIITAGVPVGVTGSTNMLKIHQVR